MRWDWDLDELRSSARPRRNRGVNGRPGKPLMVIHIGTHKTGTTSIQHYLATHRQTLRRTGFVYPHATSFGEQHAGLPGAYMQGHPFLPLERMERDPEVLLEQVRAEVPPGFNALLSSETFWELLTYLAWHFHDLHAALSRDWNVHYVYMTRDPHAKTWSAVKHMAREGMIFDPVATYARDLTTTEGTEDALLASYPDSVRIEYDGKDSVDQLLAFLLDDPVMEEAGMTSKERAVLDRMRRRRTPETGHQRINQNHSNPYSAAVTLCVVESLRTAQDVDAAGLSQFPALYDALFSDSEDNWSDAGLPKDNALHARIRRAAGGGGPIMSLDEINSVRSRFDRPDTRVRTGSTGCAAALDVALDALDQRLAQPEQPT